jgi:cell division protein FtsB
MSELDKALDRLGEAVSGLVQGTGRGRAAPDAEARIAELTAERDRLRAEVDDLRAQREIDARLRNEAAEAVREALGDLRGLVAGKTRDGQGGGND